MKNRKIRNFISVLVLIFVILGTSKSSIANIKTNNGAKAQILGETLNILNEWENLSDEEKNKTIQPYLYSTKIDNEEIDKVNSDTLELGNSELPVSYVLDTDIDYRIKNQMSTQECWAFATTSMLETNVAKTKNEDIELSPRHIDYATSRTFLDGTNTKGFNRELGMGNYNISLAYCTNGQGPVLESDMPFEDNENKVNLRDIEKKTVLKVNDYVSFANVYKKYNSYGAVRYTDGGDEVYTREQVLKVRNEIKNHIMNYGAVSAHTYLSNDLNNYISQTSGIVAYYNHDNTKKINHGICIIGWNDQFPKEYFKDQPSNDGAYLVLNSANGNIAELSIYAISYEDEWIEFANFGIIDTSEINYDNIYQYDEYGASVHFDLKDNYDNKVQSGYISNVFNRQKKYSKDEYLNEISINIARTSNVEIYINPKDDNKNNLTKVKTVGTLKPGYHTIKLSEPIKLTGTKFVVAAKLSSDYVEVATETNTNTNGLGSSYWDYATSNKGESFISIDGINWSDLNDLLLDSNICIKAFSTENEKDYMVGDVNLDGRISLIDLSLINQKMIGKTILTANQLKAADINEDGRISLIDLSLVNQAMIGKIVL